MRYGPIIIGAGVFSLLVLLAVFLILFVNRGNDAVAPVLFKIVAAVIAIAVILGIDLMRAPETMHVRTNFLVIRNQDRELLKLSPVTAGLNIHQWSGYNLMENIWLFNGYTQDKANGEIKDEEVFDELVAATFLKWLAHHYNLHWEMEHNYLYGISGGGGHASQKEGRDKKTATYDLRQSGNPFLIQDPVFNEIKMPHGSSASLTRDSLESTLVIQNPHATFTFRVLRLGNSGASHSILGDKMDARLTRPGQFYAHDYILTLDAVYSRRLRWSPGTNKQKQWLQQVFSGFERDFNWDTFKPQLERALDELPADRKLRGIPLRIEKTKTSEAEQSHPEATSETAPNAVSEASDA